MRIPHISPENVGGLADKVVGLGKELTGEFLDNRSLRESGRAQQDKGSEKLAALRAEAEADAHEAKARANEERERSTQEAKA